MKDNYSFKNAIKNPYMAHLKHDVTIHIDDATLEFLKEQQEVMNIPMHALISMHLSNCAKEGLGIVDTSSMQKKG